MSATLLVLTSDDEITTMHTDIENGEFSNFAEPFWTDAVWDGSDMSYSSTGNTIDFNTLTKFKNDVGNSDTGSCIVAERKSPNRLALDSKVCEETFPFYCMKVSQSTAALRDSETQSIILQKREVVDTDSSLDKINFIFDPSKLTERELKVTEAKQDYMDNYQLENMDISYESLFEVLWYSQLPCFDVKEISSAIKNEMSSVKQCLWKGLKIDCSLIFKTFPSDRGMCCTFNMERAEEIFKDSKYSKVVEKFQQSDLQNRYQAFD